MIDPVILIWANGNFPLFGTALAFTILEDDDVRNVKCVFSAAKIVFMVYIFVFWL